MLSHGPTESYGFHALETLQCMVERRSGGETGVAAVELLHGDGVLGGLGRRRASRRTSTRRPWGRRPHQEADAARTTSPRGRRAAPDVSRAPAAAGVPRASTGTGCGPPCSISPATSDFAFAARAERPRPVATACPRSSCRAARRAGTSTSSSTTSSASSAPGRAPYPVERTLLTTGTLAALMESGGAGRRLETPHLDVSYQAPRRRRARRAGHRRCRRGSRSGASGRKTCERPGARRAGAGARWVSRRMRRARSLGLEAVEELGRAQLTLQDVVEVGAQGAFDLGRRLGRQAQALEDVEGLARLIRRMALMALTERGRAPGWVGAAAGADGAPGAGADAVLHRAQGLAALDAAEQLGGVAEARPGGAARRCARRARSGAARLRVAVQVAPAGAAGGRRWPGSPGAPRSGGRPARRSSRRTSPSRGRPGWRGRAAPPPPG